ncbi:AarF/UbiB family protein [Nocardia sp. NPDC088792]|uniref:AarF/UbiB family protein n=1 Tax=Nocardia sp. NPDC088792 TaxID=3364332 RepID=UPI003824D86C
MTTGIARAFPTAGNYQEALQHPSLCFTHAELRDSVPELTKLRQPRAISGAFASVFPMTHTRTGHRYAVKCFTRYVPDQQARYRAISEKLAALSAAELSQPWKIGFEYLPDAVLVGASRYPVLKMEWAQGTTLAAWLDVHHRDSRAVDRVAERFAELIADLAVYGIAHGDLQHGNLLVAEDDTLRLLDYDGMFVPALAGLGGTERGHRNYQSPQRGDYDFDATLDRFSAWVIYLALKAVAIDPELWERLHEPQGEYLLLREADFEDPSISQRFPALLAHSDGRIRQLAAQVRLLVAQPLMTLPALATTAAEAPAPDGGAAGNGLPRWMAGHVAPVALLPRVEVPAALDGKAGFAGRRTADVLVLLLFLLTLLIPVVCLNFGAPVAIAAGPIVAAALAVSAARRSRVELVTLRQYVRDLEAHRRGIVDTADAAGAVQRDRNLLDASEQQQLAHLNGLRDQLRRQYDKERAEIERHRVMASAGLDRRIDALGQALQDGLAAALLQEQREFVQRELATFSLSGAAIAGIGRGIAAELAEHGIRTAADFTRIRLRHGVGGDNSVTTTFFLPNGRSVHIRGIGEATANALMEWRDRLAAMMRARCTIHAPARGPAITDQFAADRRQLEEQRRVIGSDARTRSENARQRLEISQRSLSEEAATAAAAVAKQRDELARRMAKIRNAPAELAAVDATMAAARRRRRALSSLHYLRFTVIGH